MSKIYDYWIPKIQDIYEFKQIAEAEQPEFDLLYDKVKQYPKEVIVETATNEGLSRYEKMLGLNKKSTTELRKINILQALSAKLPFTEKYFKNLLNDIIGESGYYFEVTGYHLEVGVVASKEELLEMLREDFRKKLPANISFSVKVLSSIDVNLYSGFYVRSADIITI